MSNSRDDFFARQSIPSLIKARIVTKYFKAWATILGKRARNRGENIRYVDLFAGPGRYEDDNLSTPMLILQHVIETPDLRDIFLGQFNDAHQETSDTLKANIQAMPDLAILKYQPKIAHGKVDKLVADWYLAKDYVATLTFIDPFGYAGLSAQLIDATLKDEGSECIFFFNFNRVNAAINNDSVKDHVNGLFNIADAADLRREFQNLKPLQREIAVVKKLTEVLKGGRAKHVLWFGFLNDDANRTSHYFVFATKNDIGAQIMKDIMAKESTWCEAGIPSYEYSPKPKESTLFDSIDPLPELADELFEAFAGKTHTVRHLSATWSRTGVLTFPL